MKTIFFVVTSMQTWGKGLTPKEAEKNATLRPADKTEYYLYIGVFKDCTSEELKSLLTFWGVSEMGQVVKCHDVTEEDQKLIDKYFVGWSHIHYNTNKKKAKGAHATKW
jgi:hypothetical protein